MKDWVEIIAETYSGYKPDEYPTRFFLNDEWIDVEEITDRWYQGNLNLEFPESNYYKVCVTGGDKYLLKQEVESGNWYCKEIVTEWK